MSEKLDEQHWAMILAENFIVTNDLDLELENPQKTKEKLAKLILKERNHLLVKTRSKINWLAEHAGCSCVRCQTVDECIDIINKMME